MKKYNLLKVIGIAFGVTVLLSFLIYSGSYSSGTYTGTGATSPFGIFDWARTPLITIATFIQYGVVFLAIGAFYGVLNKVGAYSKLVECIVKKWKGKEKTLLVIVSASMAILSSLTGLSILLFTLVPFLVAIISSLGYNKKTAFAATVGSILVGTIGSTFGFSTYGYVINFLNLSITGYILPKVIIFVAITALYILFVLSFSKKEKDLEIPLYEKKSTKKSVVPLIVICSIVLVILLLGLYNWYYAFKTSFFVDLHSSITSLKIGSYPIFANLLGSVSELGFWGNYDMAAVLVFASLIIGWVYSLKFDEIIESMVDGIKKMAPTAFYAMIVSVIFGALYNSSTGNNFVSTINNCILGTVQGFKMIPTILSAGVSSIFYNDFYTLMNNYYGVYSLYEAAYLNLTGVILVAVNGLIMLVAPTSIILMAGLRYMDISYKDWIKYIWKFALAILAIIIIAFVIISSII